MHPTATDVCLPKSRAGAALVLWPGRYQIVASGKDSAHFAFPPVCVRKEGENYHEFRSEDQDHTRGGGGGR